MLGLAFIGYLVIVAVGVLGPEPGAELSRLEARILRIDGGPAVADAVVDLLDVVWPFGEVRFEHLANMALFVPIGFAFPLLWPRRRWWTVPAAVGLSLWIEGVQRLVLSWRTPSLDDVVANSLGAVLGFSLWLLVDWLWHRTTDPAGAASSDSVAG